MVGMNTGLEGMRRMHDTSIFEQRMLDNGIHVWVQRPPILTDSSGTIRVVLKNVGSQLDPKDYSGIAHIFEHLPFRGTRRKPSTRDVEDPIREKGGNINATTHQRFTEFRVSGLPARDFELAVETLAEMVAFPLMRPQDLELERGAIREEYRLSESDPEAVRAEMILKTLFGTHLWGRKAIGDLNVIETITTGQLRKFHADHYHAGNIQVIVGGGFTERPDLLEIVTRHFGELQFHEPAAIPNFPLPFGRKGEVHIVEPRCARESIAMVYPLEGGWNHDTLDFSAGLLGGGVTSPLVHELRVERGLIYGGGICSWGMYPDFRYFIVDFKTPVSNYEECRGAYRRVLEDLSTDSIVKHQRGRQYERQTRFSRPGRACGAATWDIMNFGRIESCWEEEAHEDELTVADVFRLRDHLFENEPLTCIITT